jgi:hypothetical protein
MSSDDDDPETGSTIVRRGKAAFSFGDMGRFVRELEERPLERLLTDLPGLLELPEGKYGLVAHVLEKRMRQSAADRAAVERGLRTLPKTATALARERALKVLNPPD